MLVKHQKEKLEPMSAAHSYKTSFLTQKLLSFVNITQLKSLQRQKLKPFNITTNKCRQMQKEAPISEFSFIGNATKVSYTITTRWKAMRPKYGFK